MYKHLPHRQPVLTALIGALLLAGLGGCVAMGPDYQRPAFDVPASLTVPAGSVGKSPTAPATPVALDLTQWWKSFQDPVLDALLAEALVNNQDLLLATGRIEEARAVTALTNSNRYPTVDANLGATRARISKTANLIPAGYTNYGTDLKFGLSASYEFDFWGKFQRADEAARARLLSQQASRETVLSTLYATLAQNYFALRSYDAQLTLANSALTTRQENLRLQQKRFAAGSVGALDLHQAESEAAASEVIQAQAVQQVATTEAALAILAGRTPQAIITPVIVRGAPIEVLYSRLSPPADLPADLLNRRPDILAAEQLLVAANADIGQARAAYFPTIKLTSAGGYESNRLSELVNPLSLLWNLGTNLTQPVFRAGAISAVVNGAQARKTQAQAQYVSSVQSAFRDVHDALTALAADQLIFDASRRRTVALKDTLRLATLRYNNGYSSYLEVLTAQRDLLQTQSTLIDVQRAHLSAAVGLYRAVGGGWNNPASVAVR